MLATRPIAAGLIAAALTLTGHALADGPGFKHLEVLPKSISKDQLKVIMKTQARALGVDCDHCHDMPDADKDTKNKKVAREMMRMTAEINTKFIKSEEQVTCDTCHRGKEKPDSLAKR